MEFDSKRQQIRSFVLRNGKMTGGQSRAIDELLPKYAVNLSKQREKLNFAEVFSNQNPVCVDIGFGNGESILHAAEQYPQLNFLGIDVHLPGIGRLLMGLEEQGLENVKVVRYDAVDVLRDFIDDGSLSAVHVYFPDPWHKKRHHKRRLVNSDFLCLITAKLVSGGRFHFASDWQDYALQVKDLLGDCDDFGKQAVEFVPRPEWRPVTKFERRGQRLNHASYDLITHKE